MKSAALRVAIICTGFCFLVSPVLAPGAGAAKSPAVWSHSGRGSYKSPKFEIPASAATSGWRESWSYVCPQSETLAKFTTSIKGYGAERNAPSIGAFGIGSSGYGGDPHFGAGTFSIDTCRLFVHMEGSSHDHPFVMIIDALAALRT